MLNATGLRRQFDGRGGISSVSLNIPPGSIYVLCGANGSGKTTTLNVLAGLLFAETGSLTYRGQSIPLNRFAPRSGIGWIADDPFIDDDLTAWQWASFVCGIKNSQWPVDEAMAAAEQLQLPLPVLDQPIRAMSFGTRRKVALWTELMTTKALLILDEPIIGLDPLSIRGVLALSRSFVTTGRSVLLSTHLLSEAQEFGTHVGIIHQGYIVREGAMDVVCAGRSLYEAYEEVVGR